MMYKKYAILATPAVFFFFLLMGTSEIANAVSFSVDSTSGVPAGPSVGPTTNIFQSNPLDGTNTANDDFVPTLPSGLEAKVNALSAGFDPLDNPKIWDILFSVGRNDVTGIPPSDLYWTDMGMQGRNLPAVQISAAKLGLTNPPAGIDNLDAMEVFDSTTDPADEIDFSSFTVTGTAAYFSVDGGADIFVQGPPAPGTATVLFQAFGTLGLVAGDDIDALALDIDTGFFSDSDGKREALFSLAHGSPTLIALGPGFGAADIFYTNFSGAFDIAGPTGLLGKFAGNLNFPFDLTALNLGLSLASDVDALDIAFSRTAFDLVPVPEPSTFSLLIIGLIGMAFFRKTQMLSFLRGVPTVKSP